MQLINPICGSPSLTSMVSRLSGGCPLFILHTKKWRLRQTEDTQAHLMHRVGTHMKVRTLGLLCSVALLLGKGVKGTCCKCPLVSGLAITM